MSIQYKHEVAYAYEAASLVSLILDEKGHAELVKSMGDLDTYGEVIGSFPALAAEVMQIAEEIKPLVDGEDDTTRFLFEKFEDDASPLWMVFKDSLQDEPFDEKDFVSGMWELINEEAPSDLSINGIADHIMTLDKPYALKAKLALLCMRWEFFAEHAQKVAGAIELQLRPMVAAIQPQIDESMAFLSDISTVGALQALISDVKLPVQLDEAEILTIYPHLFPLNALWISGDRTGTKSVFWGCGVLPFLSIVEAQRNDAGRIIEALRIIADKTKFQILQTLGSEMLYASEIAERMKLTPATISHHLGQLMNFQMVTIIQQSNRLYYRTDKETLAEYLEAAKRLLL